jgi:predicted aminopeptidase
MDNRVADPLSCARSPVRKRPAARQPPRAALLALLTLLALLPTGCSTLRYLGQQAVGQLHLLRIRRPVEDVLADPATPPALKARLELALEARQFGIDHLGLRGGAEFTRYVDPGGPVAYNLTAADKTSLRIRRWRFPLVGSVPYLGFFKRKDVEAEAKRLSAAGLDVYIRPVGGYSTLGYLLSPIYASMVDDPGPEGEVRTVEVMLHEMAHSTAYLTSASELNESYATLVGIEGAARFFRERGNVAQSALSLRLAQEQEQRSRAFSAWLVPAMQRVREFYAQASAQHYPAERILREREEMFAALRESYRAAFPSGPRYKRLADGPLNNAVLLSFGVYHSPGRLQQDLLDSVDGDIREFVNLYKQAQDRPDGPAWLRRLAAEHLATLPADRRPPPQVEAAVADAPAKGPAS